jgi:hypothetical protein
MVSCFPVCTCHRLKCKHARRLQFTGRTETRNQMHATPKPGLCVAGGLGVRRSINKCLRQSRLASANKLGMCSSNMWPRARAGGVPC